MTAQWLRGKPSWRQQESAILNKDKSDEEQHSLPKLLNVNRTSNNPTKRSGSHTDIGINNFKINFGTQGRTSCPVGYERVMNKESFTMRKQNACAITNNVGKENTAKNKDDMPMVASKPLKTGSITKFNSASSIGVLRDLSSTSSCVTSIRKSLLLDLMKLRVPVKQGEESDDDDEEDEYGSGDSDKNSESPSSTGLTFDNELSSPDFSDKEMEVKPLSTTGGKLHDKDDDSGCGASAGRVRNPLLKSACMKETPVKDIVTPRKDLSVRVNNQELHQPSTQKLQTLQSSQNCRVRENCSAAAAAPTKHTDCSGAVGHQQLRTPLQVLSAHAAAPGIHVSGCTGSLVKSSQHEVYPGKTPNTSKQLRYPVPSAPTREPAHVQTPSIPTMSGQIYMSQPSTLSSEIIKVNGRVYSVLSLLGKGGSSKVYQVYDVETKRLLAIKCVSFADADEFACTAFRNEINLLQKLQHSDRVIKLYDYEYNEEKICLYVVMEKGETDLASLIRNYAKNHQITSEMIKFYWSEMLRAVAVIHSEGIIHSDLKPANFLLVSGKLKLIDFGIASSLQTDMTSVTVNAQVGTYNYMSPEAIQKDCGQSSEYGNNSKQNRPPPIKINVKSDVWSLGCILYNLVYGKTPFQHITNSIAKLRAISDPYHEIEFPEISDKKLVDVMKKCLVRNPKERPSIEQLLCHPYLNTQKSDETPERKPVVRSVLEQLAALTPRSFSLVSEQFTKLVRQKDPT